MRALIYIILGLLSIGLGTYNLYGGYELEKPLIAGFGFGFIIIGAIATLFGISRRRKKPKEAYEVNTDTFVRGIKMDEEQDGAIEIHAIIQAMGVVAVADKVVRQEEIDTISSIYEEMLGMKIRDAEVREILSEFDEYFDIEERLTRNRSFISPAMKRMIVQSCQRVMVSDLEIVTSEENRVMEIGIALGFSEAEVNTLIETS